MIMRVISIAALLFVLLAASVQAVTESEPNDARIQANAFTIGDTLQGGLPGSFGGDNPPVDYWSFSATGGQQYSFNATSNGSFISPLDLALDIEDSGGTVLVSKDDNGANQPENLTWTAPSGGTFYLVVWEATATQNAISTYTVSTGLASGVDDWSLY
ncbi:MAG: hypothetical protein Kow0059_07930 [Candidatus Sumerlaeia bacterium]